MEKVTFEQLNPIGIIDAPAVFTKSGDLGFFFLFKGPELLSSDRQAFLRQKEEFDNIAYSGLGDSFVIHKQDVFIEKTYNAPEPEFKTFLTNSFYSHHDKKPYKSWDGFFYVTRSSARHVDRNYSVPVVAGKSVTLPRFNVTEVYYKVCAWADSLKKLGWQLSMLDSEDSICDLLDKHFNLYRSGLNADITVIPEITIAGDYAGIQKISTDFALPPRLFPYIKNANYSGLYSDFMYPVGYVLNFDHVVNTVIKIDSSKYWKDKLLERSKRLDNYSLMSFANGEKSKANKEFIDDVLKKESGEVVQVHSNVVYWDSSSDGLRKKTGQVLDAFRQDLRFSPLANDIKL
ncbi:MAG: hypothetical protein ACKO96_31580 [Flammeovirgaceae bacterium]